MAGPFVSFRTALAAVVASGCVSTAPARLASGASAGASEAPGRAVDGEFARIADSVRVATGLPALAAAVVTGDRVLARAAVGTRRVEPRRPADRLAPRTVSTP